jgi:hypothetical protein
VSKAKDAAAVAGMALGLLVWLALIVVSLGLPVLAAIWLWQHI